MSADTETTTLTPVHTATGLLAGFNRYGLPGLVIGTLFLFLGVESYYGIRALMNNTRVMAELTANLSELRKEIKDCRDGAK